MRTRKPIIIESARHGGSCPPDVLRGVADEDTCNSNPCPGEPINILTYNMPYNRGKMGVNRAEREQLHCVVVTVICN